MFLHITIEFSETCKKVIYLKFCLIHTENNIVYTNMTNLHQIDIIYWILNV